MHNKKLNRNLQGLLSKCYKYGKLHGVRLALYVEYTDKEDFVAFESDKQHFGIKQIGEKVCGALGIRKRPHTDLFQKEYYKTRNLSPEDVEKKLGKLPPQDARRKADHPKTGQVPVQAGSTARQRLGLYPFPELPEFDMSVLKVHCHK
jgi:hypothetical protein